MSRIRIAVAGLGGRGTWGAAEIAGREEYELVGLIDVIRGRMDMLIDEGRLPRVPMFSSVEECMAAVDFDALAVFTPDGTHADVALPAIRSGKFVFVEKPMDISCEKLDAIIAADGAAGGKTFVGFNLRYAPVYIKIHELLAAGVAGQVLTIQADEFYDGGRTYFRRWNRLREWGGGLWITKACHDFDLLYWMAGSDPVSVYASASLDYYKPRADAALHCPDCALLANCPDRYSVHTDLSTFEARWDETTRQATGRRADLCLFNSDKDTFDHGIATVTFANNVVANYTVNVVAGFTNRTMRVGGTKAAIEGDLEQSKVVIRRRDPSSVEEIDLTADGGHGGADDYLFSAFAKFVHGEPVTFVGPKEASVAVRMGLAATKSSDSGEAVRMSEMCHPTKP